MPMVQMVNHENQPAGEISLSEKVFGRKINRHLLWEAIQSHQASRRRGSACTKTRAEVSGGGAKPWRQKGTGRARAGSNRSPLWRKGGVTFGPKPRDYTWELPKKMRRLAMCTALSAKLADKEMVVLDELAVEEIKTRKIVQILKNLKLNGRITLIPGQADDKLRLSGRNIKSLSILNPQNIFTYGLLDCDCLLMTRAAVSYIEENLGR